VNRALAVLIGFGLGLGLGLGPVGAMGERDRFAPALLSWPGQAVDPDASSGLERVAWELEKRTSLSAAPRPAKTSPSDAQLRRHPLLVLRGKGALQPLDERGLDALRAHLEAGGLLFIDAAEPERPLADDPFDRDVRLLVRRLFPRGALETLPRSHVLYRTFYLAGAPVGRRARSPVLEAVSLDGRVAILYSRNDLVGALARDRLGAWAHVVEPGGEPQREQAMRMLVNVAMYALCLDYKADQVHVKYLLEHGRGAAR
jgi:hypothetical protein